MRAKSEEESEAENAGFAYDVERRNDAVERRALTHADDVEET